MSIRLRIPCERIGACNARSRCEEEMTLLYLERSNEVVWRCMSVGCDFRSVGLRDIMRSRSFAKTSVLALRAFLEKCNDRNTHIL